MAAKRTRKKSKRRTKAQIAAQNQILAVLLCTIGLLFFFLAFVKGSEGWLSAHNVLLGIFGWSAFFIGPILIYISVMASFDRDQRRPADPRVADGGDAAADFGGIPDLPRQAGRSRAPSRTFSAPSTPMGRRCTAAGWRR